MKMKEIVILVSVLMLFSLQSIGQNIDKPVLYASSNDNFIIKNDGNKNIKTSSSIFEVEANPLNETLNLKLNIETQIEEISLVTNNSNLVYKTGKTRGAKGSSIEIPIEDLEPGTYYIRLKTESGTQIQRIIISN